MCPTGTSLRPAPTSEFHRAFDVIDTDHDGRISRDDLHSFYASLSDGGNDNNDSMIRAMITVADANKDGYVQYEEFERVLMKTKTGKGKEQENQTLNGDGGVMEEMFKAMDEDGDGRLGLEDLRSYLGRAGVKVGDEEIKAMIKLGGGDERQGVSFDGFVNVLAVQDFVN